MLHVCHFQPDLAKKHRKTILWRASNSENRKPLSSSSEPLETFKKHPKMIQVCCNDGPRPFSPEQNKWRLYRRVSLFVVVFSSSAPLELNKNHPWVKGIRVCSNDRAHPSLFGIRSIVRHFCIKLRYNEHQIFAYVVSITVQNLFQCFLT